MRRAATVTAPLSSSAGAVTPEEFAACMAAFDPQPDPLALAVSGGPDSMALAYLAKGWADARQILLIAFIVDHGLRPGSSLEASDTQQQLQKLGITSEILLWQHDPVVSRLHSTARKARYALLAAACKRHGLSNLALAHQREDQGETILMRLAKGSGVDGLAGMAAENSGGGLRLIRPLLAFSKDRLIATCAAAQLDYIDDPSNASGKFARGRLRRVMPLLADEGLTLERLCDLSNRAAEASAALNYYTRQFLRKDARLDAAGCIRIDLAAFRQLPRAIASRALAAALQSIHREDYAPENMSLNILLDALARHGPEQNFQARTLHGCRISATDNHILVTREFASIRDVLVIEPGQSLLWDGRWTVNLGAEAGQAYILRPLGNPPHDILDKLAPGLRRKIRQGHARACLPGLYDDRQNLALIPSLDGFSSDLLACMEYTAPGFGSGDV